MWSVPLFGGCDYSCEPTNVLKHLFITVLLQVLYTFIIWMTIISIFLEAQNVLASNLFETFQVNFCSATTMATLRTGASTWVPRSWVAALWPSSYCPAPSTTRVSQPQGFRSGFDLYRSGSRLNSKWHRKRIHYGFGFSLFLNPAWNFQIIKLRP